MFRYAMMLCLLAVVKGDDDEACCSHGDREAVLNNARQIMEQLQAGGSFVAYARQFSEASTAAVGGDTDFLRLETLPPALAQAAQQMQNGQLVGPIEIPGGWDRLPWLGGL